MNGGIQAGAPNHRYGIAEWYGQPFADLSPARRSEFASLALGDTRSQPPCPFQDGQPPCSRSGGVCSIQRYADDDGRIGSPDGPPVSTCPRRFEDAQLLVHWLAEIDGGEAMVAREVPFMQSTETAKPAGKIDLVVARDTGGSLQWYGLEIQAVYFSGLGCSRSSRRCATTGIHGLRSPTRSADRTGARPARNG